MGGCCPGFATWITNPEMMLEGRPMTGAACAEFDVNKLAGEWRVVRRKMVLADRAEDLDRTDPAKDLRLQLMQQTPNSVPPDRLQGLCALKAVWWSIDHLGNVLYLKEVILEQSNIARLSFDIQVADSFDEQQALNALTTQLALEPPLQVPAYGHWGGFADAANRPYDWFWLSGRTDRQLMLLVRSTDEYRERRQQPEEALRALAIDTTHLRDLPVVRQEEQA